MIKFPYLYDAGTDLHRSAVNAGSNKWFQICQGGGGMFVLVAVGSTAAGCTK